jgi:hypothetical protein
MVRGLRVELAVGAALILGAGLVWAQSGAVQGAANPAGAGAAAGRDDTGECAGWG